VKTRLALVMIAAALFVCAGTAARADQEPLGALPATYDGMSPCADCSGIRTTVTLRADKTFLMRQTYVGSMHADLSNFFDLGRWNVSEDGKKLILHGGAEAPRQYGIVDAKTLRQLDITGKEFKGSFDLHRTDVVDPISDTMLLHGTYTYMADAGVFQECNTMERFPVAQLEDNAALESAYAQQRSAPGAPLFATFYGHFAQRPNTDGAGMREFVVVDRFAKVTQGGSCRPPVPVRLEGTLWELTDLNGAPIDASLLVRKPSLELDAASKRASGDTSCNRLTGDYTQNGDSLRFGQPAVTRMACPPGHNVEAPYLKALAATTSFRISGGTLELLSAGKVVARFQAAAPLEGTLWNLIELNGLAVDASKLPKRPTLELDAASKRASGESSCNRFTGGYTLSGDTLRFSMLASTMMACVPGKDIEAAYLKALGEVTSFQISGNTLELIGDGNVLARYLEAP
jgi:copper homeostasis protein (lipoprotein)